MFTIVTAHGSQSSEFEFDRDDDDFEVLHFQILSLFDDLGDDFILIDFAGRELKTLQDLDELHVTTHVMSKASSTNDNEEIRLYIWVIDHHSKMVESVCSSVIFPCAADEDGIIQPQFRIIDTPFDLCVCCKKYISPGLLQPPNSNMMSLHPFQCKGKEAFEFGLTLDSYHQQSILTETNSQQQVSPDSPVGKYLRWHYMQAAVENQTLYMQGGGGSGHMSEGERQMEGRLRSGVKTVQAYEDLEQQRKGRECIDYEKVCQRAAVIAQNAPSDRPLAEDVLCLKALLEWFKHDFFKWFKKPNCSTPGCPGVSAIHNIQPCGAPPPTAEEQQRDWAGRVELYRCQDCQSLIRFPRVNNPSRLLETRVGRCGEFANAFCLICRSLGLDARWVLDFTDHVWVEIYVPSLGRYVHADPCEKSLDAPLTYEAGWNKKLSYVFAFSRFGVTDVIHRYSRKFSTSVCRSRSLCTEKFVQTRVQAIDQQVQLWYCQQVLFRQGNMATSAGVGGALTLARLQQGHSAFAPSYYTSMRLPSELSLAELKDRKVSDQKDLQMLIFLQSTQFSPEELRGRISGDKEWKEARGEAGKGTQNEGDCAVRDVEGMEWLCEGMILASGMCSNEGGSGILEIFVSSVGNDDAIDNSSNNFSSDLATQHARFIDCQEAVEKVLSPFRTCVNGTPVLSQPGRGHNITLLCAHSGAFVWSKSFDTWGDSEAGARLVAALQPFLSPLTGKGEEDVVGRGIHHREQVYVLVATVLDSGENGGAALQQFMERLLVSSYGNSAPKALPGYRESWVMVALIGEREEPLNEEKREDNDDCTNKDCSGTLYDMDMSAQVRVETSAPIGQISSCHISAVRQVLHCACSPLGKGPTTARLQLALMPRLQHSESQHAAEVHFQELDMYVPSTVTQYTPSLPDESLAAFIDRVKSLSCADTSSSGGFVVTSATATGLEGAEGERGFRAYLFSTEGFPLRRMKASPTADGDVTGEHKHSRVYIKSLSASGEDSESGSGATGGCQQVNSNGSGVRNGCGGCLKYVSLGGAHHPDTIAFDTTLGLEGVPSDVCLAEVRFTGEPIVESVRCRYQRVCDESASASTSGVVSWSPQLAANVPSPSATSSPPKCITSVSIKHGDLVDSITLRYSTGEVVKAGGSGGSTSRTVDVDVAGGERVMGFFGGIGGHIHHFGVILYSKLLPYALESPRLLNPSDNRRAREGLLAPLCSLATKHKLWENRFASAQQRLWPKSPINADQLYNAGRLLRSLLELHASNDTAAFRKCVQTTILYTLNIVKNIPNPTFLRIKLSNKNFQNFVLSLNFGLSFFLCSPVYWQVPCISDHVVCCDALVQESSKLGNGAELKSMWLESMSAYCMFLSDVLKMEQFQNM